MPRMDEEKLHTRKFQLKGSGGKTRCKLLQKRFTGKTTERSKHLRHIAIEKDILPQLKYIFQISLKYINLVIPKILFILVLCSFNFSIKILEFNFGKFILDNSRWDKIIIVDIGVSTLLSKTPPPSYLPSPP